MASKRKSVPSPNFNFRPQAESQKWETKGTKPLPTPVSVSEALLTMVIHVCRKVLFVNTNLKIVFYTAGLFLSFVGDVYPFPKSYFSRSDNMFNVYFVKLGWAWTLTVTLPFVVVSSITYCCGKRDLILKHLSRLAIATIMWFVFTKSFAYIEHNFGRCSVRKFNTKQSCLSGGNYWHSLDISGHTFILIYSTLVIIEEARAIIGWESIKDLIRNENHTRATGEEDVSSPLKQLSDYEFSVMKTSYTKFLPYTRSLFIAMTLLTLIWDLMILSTILYFHTMVEKLISGILAISVWFVTYKVWFPSSGTSPCAPGEGMFKYNKSKKSSNVPLRSRSSITSSNTSKSGDLPRFMGMPLYGLRTQEAKEEQDEAPTNGSETEAAVRASAMPSKWRGSQPQMTSRTGVLTRSQANSLRNNGNVTI